MIEADVLDGAKMAAPFYVPWPIEGNPGAILAFTTPDEWLAFLRERDLHNDVPQIVSNKYARAQRLYALSWLDLDLMKAAELVAITALEAALKERFAGVSRKERPMLGGLLRHLVLSDGLGNTELPFTRRYGGKAADLLYESEATRKEREAQGRSAQPTLLSIRNGLAHGDPFDGLPWSGLLELIRDLIEYVYRDMIDARRPTAPLSGMVVR
ncbi:hypothetical protein FB593_11824 [Rhizobium sp. SJZ105]|uniref:hypothetical protein n=1 Tax=Rhizobium sp. SJZ105 TaxID=2572678 RepID=UPI0011A277BC|nr:hypothetical protein [Rhizobium sp. SJZ105]TWC77162.1 hypothetical protein FB593_11824 [Rhizobium sp. SJZ105]